MEKSYKSMEKQDKKHTASIRENSWFVTTTGIGGLTTNITNRTNNICDASIRENSWFIKTQRWGVNHEFYESHE